MRQWINLLEAKMVDGFISSPSYTDLKGMVEFRDFRGIAYGDEVFLADAENWLHDTIRSNLGIPSLYGDESEPERGFDFYISSLKREDDAHDISDWFYDAADPQFTDGEIIINTTTNDAMATVNKQFRRMISGMFETPKEITEANPWRPQDMPTFYHGTTSRHLDTIEKVGLQPQPDPVSGLRGNNSTVPGYTEHNVYLTTSLMFARAYANVQVRNDEKNGIEGTYSVVFEVQIPDPLKLFPDDDLMNKNSSYHYWTQLKPEDRLMYPLDKAIKPPRFGGSIVDHATERAAHEPYTRSLKYNESVAYRGRIPARFLKLLPPKL